MELSSLIFFLYFRSKISELEKKNPLSKMFLYFFSKKKLSLYFNKWIFLIFSQKNSSYISGKWNFLALRVKNFLYFLKKRFPYISGNGIL